MAKIDKELGLFLPGNLESRDWLRWARDAERLLAERVAVAVPEAGVRVQEMQRGDVVTYWPEAGNPFAIELKLWRYSPKNLNNRIAEMLSTAVLLRRDFNMEAQLGLLVLLTDTPGDSRPSAISDDVISRLSRLIRSDEGDAGFDRIVVGILGSDGRWVEVDGQGSLAPLGHFREAIARLSSRRLFGDPRDVDRRRPRVALPGGGRAEQRQPPKILLIADEWRSHRGGISTFNRELAIAFAAAGCQVHVVVPAAEQDERDEALDSDVTLVTPDSIPGIEGHQLLLTRPRFADGNYCPDAIIGHGRILGPYAYTAQNLFFPDAKRVHVVHTDAERLEMAKEPLGGRSSVLTADERLQLEVELSLSADLVAGVGPLLTEAISDAMRGARQEVPPVVDLWPGLRDWGETVNPDDPPRRRQVLLIARAEDLHSKGIDIAASAVARANSRFGTDPVDAPVLVIRGVPRPEADEIKRRIDEVVAPEVNVIARPYSADPDALRRDLWQSRVVVMPSRHEGFGLVALEAISAGVPVLLSRESGLGRMLRDVVEDGERSQPREILPVPASTEEAAEIWGDALYELLVDPAAAFQRAARLREQVAASTNWERAVNQLLGGLGLGPRESGAVSIAPGTS